MTNGNSKLKELHKCQLENSNPLVSITGTIWREGIFNYTICIIYSQFCLRFLYQIKENDAPASTLSSINHRNKTRLHRLGNVS